MEDTLDVYTRPHDATRPLICLEEISNQLLADTRPPTEPAPGRPRRVDSEYERRGTANLFLVCEPLRGWRHVTVSDRRTRLDWAACIKDLVDVRYPEAEKIVLAQDNLNTHTPTPIRRAHCTKHSHPTKRNAWPTRWNSTTPPNMEVGSTSPRSS
jgi:hypothetical protein